MATSILKQILDGTQRELVNLNLTGINPHSIIIQKVYSDNEDAIPELPGIIIVPLGPEQIDSRQSPLQENHVIYGVGVAFFAEDIETGISAHDIQDQDLNFDQRLVWRETTRRHFHSRRLRGVPSVQKVTMEPNAVVDTARWLNSGMWLSAFTLKFHCRESRIPNDA